MTALGRIAAGVAGCLLLAACGGDFSVYSLPLPGGADVGEQPYTVKVQFRDVLDLVPQSSVKVDDVSVGKVEDITVDDWTATVTLELNGDVRLPDDAVAEIRQTSLLGEKFVSLAPPPGGGGGERLGDGDLIPLSRSGRNPEVEEVLGALSLVLNGGGIGQLQTINRELNAALTGREPQIRDLLTQLVDFTGQLDDNKQQILRALRQLDTLSKAVLQQKDSIYEALDVLPGALRSLDSQRDELVTMLKSLQRLSGVGTRVIRASKADTVQVLQNLAPILRKLADTGDAFPQSLQIALTYPFMNATVGETPVAARNLHQGDYTNLSVQLDLSLQVLLDELPDGPPLPPGVCEGLGLPEGCTVEDIIDKVGDTPLPDPVCAAAGLEPGCTASDLPGANPLPDPPPLPGGGTLPGTGNAGPLGGDGSSSILPGGSGGGSGDSGESAGSGSGGSGGTDTSDVCRVTGLCRTSPAASGSALGGPDLASTLRSDEVDPDVAELFLVGVVAQ